MAIIMMKARQGPLSLSCSGGSRVSSFPQACTCSYVHTLSNNKDLALQLHRLIHNESFIQFDVEQHSLLQALVQARRAVDMFILLESKSPPPIPDEDDQDWRSVCPITGRCMILRAHPLHPSIFAPLLQRMGTSDWSLPRVTSIAQAGGAARCSSAVAMAADKLLSWLQGSKYTVHPYKEWAIRISIYKGNEKREDWTYVHSLIDTQRFYFPQ